MQGWDNIRTGGCKGIKEGSMAQGCEEQGQEGTRWKGARMGGCKGLRVSDHKGRRMGGARVQVGLQHVG